MRETTTCEVNNTADNKSMTIITEWNDEELNIIVCTSDMTPLIAKTTINEMYGCMQRKKPREEFFEETKNDLSGEDKGVQFSLRASRLTWKKDMWMRGMVTMRNIDDISDSMNVDWIIKYFILQKTTSKLEKENEILKNKTEHLTNTIKEMEKIKKCMEESLYKQFILLLNSKKKKIRDLEEKLTNRNVVDDRSVYDENTDASDNEQKISDTPKKRSKHEKSPSPIASTSKKVFASTPMSGSETDDEIVLRYDESQTQILDKINDVEDTAVNQYSRQSRIC